MRNAGGSRTAEETGLLRSVGFFPVYYVAKSVLTQIFVQFWSADFFPGLSPLAKSTVYNDILDKAVSNFGVEELVWAGQSSGLNPIQHLWAEPELWL